MTIPVSTHRISVERGADPSTVDPWESDDRGVTKVAERVCAVIAAADGRQAGREGELGETVAYTLTCDPVDLTHLDVVIDEETGQRYAVVWVVHSPGLAGVLASVRAGLSTRQGFGQESRTA